VRFYLKRSALSFLRSSALMILMSPVTTAAGPVRGVASTAGVAAGVASAVAAEVMKRSSLCFFLSAISIDSIAGEIVPNRSALFRKTSNCSALISTLALLAGGAVSVAAATVIGTVVLAGVAAGAGSNAEPNRFALSAKR
jgi:hypothetical protein